MTDVAKTASRLLSLVLLLQNRGRMTARQLAAELEVSVRTVYRDVDALSAAGVPVYGESGHAGGFALVAGYRTRLTGLHDDEADALALSGLPGPASELGLGADLAAAQLKLDAALPPALRERSARVRERFHLDTPRWYRDAEEVPHLLAVAAAVWNRRTLRVHYHRWAKPQDVRRELRPLGIVLKAGTWYLVAESLGPSFPGQDSLSPAPPAPAPLSPDPLGADGTRGIRTYRVSQIRRLEEAGDEPFDRPAGFDLTEYWRAWLAGFDARRFRDRAVLRLTAEAWRRFPELVDVAVRQSAQAHAEPPDENGRVRTVVPIESLGHAVGEVLRLGPGVEVLEPAELRRQVADAAAALLRLHQGPA
ncbi:WYL domain-containing protein [Streptomyces sp. NBC_00820]|uniref:helix-turn-helix transcriptional regulator n=1 Tax=Streptomyces sp. NBC_00820 TaxID=2975842 RepID=UPI002ED296A2|nr:WYL domain-containing protein [Streptomyces sp. NBC_00820]